MARISQFSGNTKVDGNAGAVIQLNLEVRDVLVLAFLQGFPEPERSVKALDALKAGVIAIQSATLTLDTGIVKEEFSEMEGRLKEHAKDFQKEMAENLKTYFKERDGIVPKSLDGLFGKDGILNQTFNRYFHPQEGRLAELMESQIGPASKFGRALDPENKKGIIALIETKVAELVQEKLHDLLKEFSLDEDGSAMSRLKGMIAEGLNGISKALGIKAGQAAEAEKGHTKGFNFEVELYNRIAEWGRQLGDGTDLVRGVSGVLNKKGDHLITLGETTGAPGLKIVVEAKNQKYKLKEAIDELQMGKKNREAVSGIFAFAKGCEPTEVGNYRRIGDDFFCTVDKEALAAGGPLIFLWAAYEIARVQAVAAVRKDGNLDLEKIRQNIDSLNSWVPRLGEMTKKAGTIQDSGKAIEIVANEMKKDMEQRIKEILEMLRQYPAA